MTREHVFEEPQSFVQCHASTLVGLPNGAFIAAWFGGTREKHADTAIWCAQRQEGTWSAPRRIMKVNDQAHWNPVLFYESPTAMQDGGRGRLHLWFKTGADVPTWRTWYAVSTDLGVTWKKAEPVQPEQRLPLGPVKNKPIRLADGALLAGLSDEACAQQTDWRAHTARSLDGGLTWGEIAAVPVVRDPTTEQAIGVIQPALWESTPGCVHMLLRSTAGWLYRSDSTDNGETWSRRRDLEREPGEYSYPAIIPTARGMAISYTSNRKRISFWHGSIEAIRRTVEIRPVACPAT